MQLYVAQGDGFVFKQTLQIIVSGSGFINDSDRPLTDDFEFVTLNHNSRVFIDPQSQNCRLQHQRRQ